MIFYNAWDLNHKKPFGAVPVGTEVFFSIIADQCSAASALYRYHGRIQNGAGWQPFFCLPAARQTGTYFLFLSCFYGSRNSGFSDTNIQAGKVAAAAMSQKNFSLRCIQSALPFLPGTPRVLPIRFSLTGLLYPAAFNFPKPNSFLYGSWEDKPMYIKQDGDVVRWDFFGGNLKGIQEKLPYLKDLNVTVLYLNPIFESSSNHRYSTGDYSKIDPMLGTLEDFQNLVSQAEKIGIKIILDGVFNHTGADSFSFNKFGAIPPLGLTKVRTLPIIPGIIFVIFLTTTNPGGESVTCPV